MCELCVKESAASVPRKSFRLAHSQHRPSFLRVSWPWCWWAAVVLDHYSRRVMGFAMIRKPPTSVEVRACLGRAIGAAGRTPKYLISDKGSQFFPTAGYKKWCRHRGIRPRFGALGKHGSRAILERAIRT